MPTAGGILGRRLFLSPEVQKDQFGFCSRKKRLFGPSHRILVKEEAKGGCPLARLPTMAVALSRLVLPMEISSNLCSMEPIRTRKPKQIRGLPKTGVRNLSVSSSFVANSASEVIIPSEQRVYDVVLKQAALVKELSSNRALEGRSDVLLPGARFLLDEAYDRCGEVCEEYAKTFYLGTLLMTAERRKAIWAIYVWCRRTDELVDGPNASHITPAALDRWEGRLEDLFAGRPYDMLDAALSDTVAKFPVDIQPFKDMIEGMRTDLKKSRYKNFDELYLYCYYVAGTVGLMSVPIMGIAPESQATTESVYNAALALGIANQLTNILRDVGEDARRGRVYLPQDELAQAGLSDDDIFAGRVTDKWRNFMRSQIKRARLFFDQAETGVTQLSEASRWPVWASLLLYRQILDEIEANDYNNFTKRAYVSKAKKLLALPVAYGRSLLRPSRTLSPSSGKPAG